MTMKTKTPTRSFEQKLAPFVGPTLFFCLVAISSFLLGKSYQAHLNSPTTVSADTATAPTNTSAIDQIQGAISSPTAPSTAQSATKSSSAAKSTNSPSTPAGLININTADLTALESLTGIGPTKAQAIIDYRTQNGPFTSIDELDNVKGIGPATISKIRAQVTI